jgi:hypothetical protein
VTLYTADGCASSVAASGSAGDFADPGLTVSVADDSSTTFYATATDAAGNTSACSADSITYVEDSSGPDTPTITDTDPDSPANDNNPEVKGTAESGSTVTLYTTSDCTGTVAASGSASSFASPGLTAAVSNNSTTNFYATATDGTGNTSGCSGAFTYVEDSSSPAAPTITDTDPDSPANDNNPEVKGTAEASSTVKLYTNATCTGTPMATGSASSFATPGLTATVSNNTTTDFRVTATDAAGNTSACSAAVTYVADSSPPAAPTITDTEPDSPANDNNPEVKGTAESGATVNLYETSDCSGTPEATGSAASFATPGLTATVADGSTTNFRVTATDAAGNTSACSGAFTYTEKSNPPETSITSGPAAGSRIKDSTPTFGFTSDEPTGDSFECKVDGAAFGPCSGPGQTHTTAVLADGSHTFRVRATDEAGNVDATPATRTFTVDTDPPETSITSGPAQNAKVKDSTPTFGFTSDEPTGDTFECRIDGGAFGPCSGPGQTHTTAVLADGTHNFRVRATDAAGNVDATPTVRTFIVDTNQPETSITSGPAAGSRIKDSTPTFGFTSDEPTGDTFECRIDGGAFGPCSGPGQTHTTAPLADGTHTFRVRATDAAGNIDATPTVRTFTVDTDPPETSITSGPAAGSTTADSTPTFGFTSDEPTGDTFECRIDGGAFGPCSGPGQTHTTAPLADGTHTFRVKATDAAGNVDATPTIRTFTVNAP